MAIVGVTQTVLECESEPPEKQIVAARRVAGTIAKEFGMSPKDLPDSLRARFEELGKRPGAWSFSPVTLFRAGRWSRSKRRSEQQQAQRKDRRWRRSQSVASPRSEVALRAL